MWWQPRKREPLSLPLLGPPTCIGRSSSGDDGASSGTTSTALCDPVLVLGVLRGIDSALGDVYRNDLVYSRTTQWKKSFPCDLDNSVLLHILHYLDGDDLMKLRQVYKGTVVIDDSILYDKSFNVQGAVLETLKQQHFRAIVVADNCISEAPVEAFVRQQYEDHGVNVVVMAIEGTFNLSYLTGFGVSWRMVAYTKETYRLTESGRKVLGAYAFPFDTKYSKSHLIVGDDHELFEMFVNPEDYDEDDTIPNPQPGSPVIVHRNPRGSCISYFGFVNSLDVSYGAIMLRLCYADLYL